MRKVKTSRWKKRERKAVLEKAMRKAGSIVAIALL